MGSRDKLERKARRDPGGLRIEDVVRLAESGGFSVARTTGGHYVLVHPRLTYTVGLAEPHGSGDSFVKSIYVRKLLSGLDEVRDADATTKE